MLNQLVCSIAQVIDETGISLFVLIFAKKRQEVAGVAGSKESAPRNLSTTLATWVPIVRCPSVV